MGGQVSRGTEAGRDCGAGRRVRRRVTSIVFILWIGVYKASGRVVVKGFWLLHRDIYVINNFFLTRVLDTFRPGMVVGRTLITVLLSCWFFQCGNYVTPGVTNFRVWSSHRFRVVNDTIEGKSLGYLPRFV